MRITHALLIILPIICQYTLIVSWILGRGGTFLRDRVYPVVHSRAAEGWKGNSHVYKILNGMKIELKADRDHHYSLDSLRSSLLFSSAIAQNIRTRAPSMSKPMSGWAAVELEASLAMSAVKPPVGLGMLSSLPKTLRAQTQQSSSLIFPCNINIIASISIALQPQFKYMENMENIISSSSSSLPPESERDFYAEYFETEVRTVFSALMLAIVKSKPENILEFASTWFQLRKGDPDKNSKTLDTSEDENDNFTSISDELFAAKKPRHRRRRAGLTSQVSGPYSRRESIQLSQGTKKSGLTHMRLLFFCQNNFLFNSFSEEEMDQLIRMMIKQQTTPDQVIFEEGEWGDRIYFVDEGFYECLKHDSQSDPKQDDDQGQQKQESNLRKKKQSMQGKSIRFYHVGDTFGQVCLLHLVKRSASIICRGAGALYTLDRHVYVHFKKMCIIKRREIYRKTLRNQTMFRKFEEEELDKIIDVLIEVRVEENTLVINEGDMGAKFYIILEGNLVAYQGSPENIVKFYKEGDSFGEIALFKDTPRLASVKALSYCRLVYLTQEIFKRIFADSNLSQEIDDKYGEQMMALGNRRRQRREEHKEDEGSM